MKVREVLRRLRSDGWVQVKSKGAHRQFKHQTKRGRVTVSGKPGDTVPPGTLASIFRQAGWDEQGADMKRYAIVIEDAGTNLAAYVPDLPGCIATGRTKEEVEQLIREAIELHLEGMAEDGLAVPEPSSQVEYVVVNAKGE
jgi:predicted RNA binding protein YcfA (HicA-like mRNA interferase family)/predicted RNase H-like HicB family nuclease